MEKRGILTEKSKGDLNLSKKAEYIDEDGLIIGSEEEKHLLKNPKRISFEEPK